MSPERRVALQRVDEQLDDELNRARLRRGLFAPAVMLLVVALSAIFAGSFFGYLIGGLMS